MKRTKSYLLATIGLAVLVGSLVLAGAGSSNAAPGAQDVRVVNTVDFPVPTRAQGTTNIAGTVQAQQSGSWNVGIAGTPTFEVGNTAVNPVWVRDVEGVARQPFETEGDALDLIQGVLHIPFTVPIGKRFVIKHISVVALVPVGSSVRVQLSYSLAGTSRSIDLVMTPQGTFSLHDEFVTSQPVEIAADSGGLSPNNELRFLSSAGAVSTGRASLSGYLVDMP